MFKCIKKTVLASRIKKATTPALQLADASGELYVEMITLMARGLMPLVEITANIVHDHADEVAEVLIAAQPLIQAFKNAKEEYEKGFTTYNDKVEATNSPWMEKIEQYIEKIKKAFKITE